MSKFIKAIIYAIITLPLLVTPFTVFPTHFGKVMFFQMLVVIGLALLLVNHWSSGTPIKIKHPLFVWIILFLGVMITASLLGENFTRSLEGIYFRNNGLIIWLHLLGFFVLLNTTFKTKEAWQRLFSYFVMIGTVVAGLGIMQRFFTVWTGIIDQSGRVSSTIGNPIFLGAYLLFVFFLAAYLLSISSFRRKQIILSGCLLLNLIAIYFTESGGVFIGLFVGLILMMILFLRRTKATRARLLAIGGLCFIILGLGIFFRYQKTILTGPLKFYFRPIDRVIHISPSTGTGQTRVWAWQMGLEGIKARPIIGWGVANFETIADRYYNPKFLEHSFAETVWDRPHNILIEVATETGLVGLALFIALWVAVFRTLWKNAAFGYQEKTILSALLAAYLVQNNFGLDTFSSLMPVVLIFSFVGIGRQADENIFRKSVPLLIFLVSVLGIVFFRWSLEPIRAAYYLNHADLATYQDGEEWENNALKILNYHGVYANDFRLSLARNILHWDGTDNLPYIDLKKGLVTLIQSFEDLIKIFPHHFNYYYYLGQLYQIQGEHEGKEYFSRSEQILLQARKLSPNRQAVTFVLGKNYFLSGEFDKAVKEMEEIIKRYPENLDGHLYYGLILARRGDQDRATDEFLFLGQRDYNGGNLNFLFEIGDLIKSARQYSKLVLFYGSLLEHHPKEEAVMAKLAQAQWLNSEKEAAEATIAQLKKLIGSSSDLDTQWLKFKKMGF